MPIKKIDLAYTDDGNLIFVQSDECPIRDVLDKVSEKWSLIILLCLRDGSQRFMELKRRIEGISQRMLTQTLRRLERDGLLIRTIYPEVPPKVEYELTKLGKSIIKPIEGLVAWADKNHIKIQSARNKFDAL